MRSNDIRRTVHPCADGGASDRLVGARVRQGASPCAAQVNFLDDRGIHARGGIIEGNSSKGCHPVHPRARGGIWVPARRCGPGCIPARTVEPPFERRSQITTWMHPRAREPPAWSMQQAMWGCIHARGGTNHAALEHLTRRGASLLAERNPPTIAVSTWRGRCILACGEEPATSATNLSTDASKRLYRSQTRTRVAMHPRARGGNRTSCEQQPLLGASSRAGRNFILRRVQRMPFRCILARGEEFSRWTTAWYIPARREIKVASCAVQPTPIHLRAGKN